MIGEKAMTIKRSVIDGLSRYVNQRVPTGSFLKAVLENNLKETVLCADEENTLAIHEIVRYCYVELPSICWGSPEKVQKWLERRENE
jgi:hypothetical protein